jgi:hypothetical protein
MDKAKIYINLLKNLLSYLFANLLIKLGPNSQTISKYLKIDKRPGNDDLFSLNAIIDKQNIDSLISNYELKVNDKTIFNEINDLKWINENL